MLIFFLARLSQAGREIRAHRLVQFQMGVMNDTQFGSTRVMINHQIANITSKPSSKQAIITPISSANISMIERHLSVSSPIIFVLPSRPVNTQQIEHFLLNHAHKSPIYFINEIEKVPHGYTHLKTTRTRTNSLKQNTNLKNIIGKMNIENATGKKIIVVTMSYDTFSAAPSLNVGANNGLALSAFLESMRILSEFKLPKKYGLIFALTSGRFCGMEGISRYLENQMKIIPDIEFAISFESIYSSVLHGHIGKCSKLNKNNIFTKFLINLKELLKKVHIPIEFKISDAQYTQQIFNNFKVSSIAISGGSVSTSLTDVIPDFNRSDNFAWAFTESILHTIYNYPLYYEIINRSIVDTSLWEKSVGMSPRVAPFIDKTLTKVFEDWMSKFSTVNIEDWKAKNCFTPYSATDCFLLFYNPIPTKHLLLFSIFSIFYGFVIFFVISGFNSSASNIMYRLKHLFI